MTILFPEPPPKYKVLSQSLYGAGFEATNMFYDSAIQKTAAGTDKKSKETVKNVN